MLLLAMLLCVAMMASCGDTTTGAETSAETTLETQIETALATEAETLAETQAETQVVTEGQTEVATQVETTLETVFETLAETQVETQVDTGVETEAETFVETEAQTEMPRYDYFGEDVAPNVQIQKSDYENMALTIPADLQITDEDVMAYIDYLRFQERVADNGNTQVKDQPLKLGDTAYIYYEGFLNGEAFDGGSNMEEATPYALGLGSGSFIPGFEEGLVGLVPNTTSKEAPFELHVTFPENYGNPDLDGKEVVFKVVVEYAVQYTLPAYDRDFVENTIKFTPEEEAPTDGMYLAKFEAYIKAYLEKQNASYVESAKIDALWTYLTENFVFTNLPAEELAYYQDMYESEIEYAYEYFGSMYGEEFKKEYDTIDKFAIEYMGFEAGSDWKEEVGLIVAALVKKDMLIHAIAELEDMETVTEEELNAEIEYWIEYYGGSQYVTKEDILENLGEDYLRESAFAVKMETFLMSKATFAFDVPGAFEDQ